MNLNAQSIAYLNSPQALADLIKINAQFIDNFVRNDVAAHTKLLHPAFMAIQSNGSRVDRATYLERWATGFSAKSIPYWDVRDELITVLGAVALVRSCNKYIARINGAETTGMTVYTDTYLYNGNAWQCIQAQITPVAKAFHPPDGSIVSVYVDGVKQD